MADEATRNKDGVPSDPNVRELSSKLTAPQSDPAYSDISSDGLYFNKYVVLPMRILKQRKTLPAVSKLFNKHRYANDRLFKREEEWVSLGVQGMEGWEHFMIHPLEPHVLCFRRPIHHADPSFRHQ